MQGHQNTYKRHDKLGYSSICYIGSDEMGANAGSLQVIDIEVILEGKKYVRGLYFSRFLN